MCTGRTIEGKEHSLAGNQCYWLGGCRCVHVLNVLLPVSQEVSTPSTGGVNIPFSSVRTLLVNVNGLVRFLYCLKLSCTGIEMYLATHNTGSLKTALT